MHVRCRRHRRWITFVALFGLLFQQVAMASYLCPNEGGRPGAVAVIAKSLPCHAGVASDKARCDQHCAPSPLTSDHPPMPTVPALLPATVWLPALDMASSASRVDDAGIAARASSPPLIIQHCSFQI